MSNSSTTRPQVLRGDAAANAANAMDRASLAAFDPRLSSRGLTASEQAEAARVAALENGYSDGLEAARRDVEAATEEANKRVRRALAALCEAADGFDQRQTVALAQIEDEVVATAFAIARSILQRELQLMTDPGAEAIARAMKLVPNRGDVIARLNPEDVATLSLDRVSTTTRSVEVVADPSIESGGCIVEIGETHIDAQLSSVLAKVGEALGLASNSDLMHIVRASEHAARNNSVAAGSSPTDSRTTDEEPPVQ